MLENVDRLLKSPAKQRGRDFGIILSCLWQLNYMVEWRVINGADYGCPQRRRRTFIFAAHQSTNYYKEMMRRDRKDVLLKEGFFARGFPISSLSEIDEVSLPADLVECSNSFAFPFQNTGWMESGTVYTAKTESVKEAPVLLKDILESDVDDKYYITPEKMEKWEYLKSAKKLERINKQTGFAYTYSEGPVPFPDSWEKPARTILTSESSVSRTSHAVIDPVTGAYRVLTPVEVERIQTFPDNWTNTGMSERFRYFCMGNALITTLITRMGKVLDEIIEKE